MIKHKWGWRFDDYEYDEYSNITNKYLGVKRHGVNSQIVCTVCGAQVGDKVVDCKAPTIQDILLNFVKGV